MANIVSVDDFITDEWYPGFKPEYGHAAWCTEPINTFKINTFSIND